MSPKYEIEQLGDIAVVIRDEKKEPFAFGGLRLKTGELCGVYVDPKHRGEGVEKLIVSALVNRASLQYIPRIHAKVRWCYPILAHWLTRVGMRHFHWFEIDVPKALRVLTPHTKPKV